MRGAADGTALVQTQLAGVGQVSRRWGGDGAVQGRAQRGATGTNAHATWDAKGIYGRGLAVAELGGCCDRVAL
jgi:hypothetical protein